MLERSSKSERRDRVRAENDDEPSRPFLRMKPQSFFSNKFELEIVEEPSEAEPKLERRSSFGLRDRLLDLDIVLLILLIGVPLLAYCIMTSAS